MSLLLDALKKAAEKKARKSGQAAADTEDTRVDTTRVDTTRVEPTETTESLARTERMDATEVDETQRLELDRHEQTLADTTQLDPTEVDSTEVEEAHTETQRLAPDEAEETHVETVQLDATDFDRSREADDGEGERIPLETARSDPTEVDVTEVDDTHAETRRIDSDEAGAPDDGGQSREPDITEYSAVDTTTDPTMLVMDDSIPVDAEGNTLIETDEFTAEELARLREASRPELTEDDVTAFMGDGHDSRHDIDATSATRTVEMKPLTLDDIQPVDDSRLGSDDTTLTNPEERARLAMDDTTARGAPSAASDTDTVRDTQPRAAIDEDEQSTVINPESHAAAVDLDRLTQEQTLGAQTSTVGRSFAPDNYDRTLIKLSEGDVSRIFPGMKPPEPGAVMTPDYAKKVFMSKSGRHRGRYLKLMGVAGLALLLIVGLWGLYDVSEETQRIDSSLARLKRDPMPGIIQPPKEEKIELFAPATGDDAKALGTELPAAESPAESIVGDVGVAAAPAAEDRTDTAPVGREKAAVEKTVTATAQAAAGTASTAAAAKPAAAPATRARPASLQLSSSERIDDRDRMLGDAYAAYERGDLAEARRLYAAVLGQEPENRDALLGMAAIEVQDGDYNRAIELYRKLLLLNPKDAEAMASLVAVANIDPQRGETRIKQMLSEQPDSPYLYFTLGNMYSRQQRWSEAQAAYFQALQLRPDDPNTAYNLAVSLEHLGKPGVATEYYRRALANRDRALAIFDADQVEQRIEVLAQ